MQLCYKIKSLIRFCASIISFFKIINMRGYLWIFNWWWPYSPNPSCPLALKNDLKILICSFCFVSSFHFAIPLQPSANRFGWLGPAPRPSAESIFYFLFLLSYFLLKQKLKKWQFTHISISVVGCCWFWFLKLETWEKARKKKQWPMKLNIANVTQHADCCRQLNVEREKMNFNIICYSVLCD